MLYSSALNLVQQTPRVCGAGRHIFAIVTGFALLFYPFGYGVLHLLVPSALTYLVMLQIREYSATLSWIINFTYLIAW
jgi:lysophospholipid acyltransferase